MSQCTHPVSALYVDRTRGTTHCTVCGDLVMDQQLELDPIFARGDRPTGGLRSLGHFRPIRATAQTTVATARPAVDAARRGMLSIARVLEISAEMVEKALGIYKLATAVNAVSGTSSVVLCACLYAVCRRERTSHVIYDFAEVCEEGIHAILSYMKHICEATNTELPVVDPSCLVQRFAEQMALGEKTADVVVCALKVLRAMRDDWISCGRRPMGVCAAALLVACYVFGIQRSPEQICGMVRLTSNTITRRLNEFADTPTATLRSIDDYRPSNATLPPAFNESSRKATEDDVNASMRELSALYYDLVTEAKMSCPATPERCVKWRRFIEKHCELEEIVPSEENLDLMRLSPEAQLQILGLPHTKPIAYEVVEMNIKREEEKLLIKQESLQVRSENRSTIQNAVEECSTSSTMLSMSPTHTALNLFRENSTAGILHHDLNFDDPQSFRELTDEYRKLLTDNAEVRGLREDFDFEPGVSSQSYTGGLFGQPTQNQLQTASQQLSNTNDLPYMTSSPPARGGDDAASVVLEDMLRDKERRHALPWEFIVLQKQDLEDTADIIPYLVLSNEERLHRQKVGQALYREKWERGRARTQEEIDLLEESKLMKRRRRSVVTNAVSVPDALERALRGRGAGTVDASHISDLIPDILTGEDDIGLDDDWA